ncbi:TM2 domain-containing protein [Corynebacterium heidelbergense]|nr:TM2 domain-containing protein [Corynebacterium heidelbergense]
MTYGDNPFDNNPSVGGPGSQNNSPYGDIFNPNAPSPGTYPPNTGNSLQPGYQAGPPAAYPPAQQGYAPGYAAQAASSPALYGAAVKEPKSKVAALLLVIFFGGLGVHNLYVGNTKQGIAQMVLTLVGLFSLIVLIGGVVLFAVGLWVIADIIMMVTDSGYYSRDKVNWT